MGELGDTHGKHAPLTFSSLLFESFFYPLRNFLLCICPAYIVAMSTSIVGRWPESRAVSWEMVFFLFNIFTTAV